MKTTTLQRLHDNKACERGYNAIAAVVGVNFTGDIPLETILDNPGNGLTDCIWSLRATDGGKEIAQEFAIRVAKKVYFDPVWVRWANNWLNGTDRSTTAADAAADAAYADAAADAVADAAYAAYAAADAAADAAYADAVADAAYAAAYAAAAAVADAAAAAVADAAREKMRIENTELLRSLIK